MNRVTYDFHGRRIVVRSGDAAAASLLDDLFRAYRATEDAPDRASVEIEITPVDDLEEGPIGRLLGVAADGTRFVATTTGELDIRSDGVGWARVGQDRAQVHVRRTARGYEWKPAFRVVEPVVVELLKQTELYSVHAAAVEIDGAAMILCGQSGSGKSTLGLAMSLRGAGFLGDDTSYVDARDGAVVRARWSDLHLTDLTLETLVPEDVRAAAVLRPGAAKWFLPVANFPALRPVASAPAGWLVFPTIAPDAASSLTPIDGSEALARLLKQSLVPSRPEASTRQFDVLASLCRECPAYDLQVGEDLAKVTTELFRITER